MKYDIRIPINEEDVIKTEIKCRWDAKNKTLAEKIIHAIHPLVRNRFVVKRYQYYHGTIWTNGGYSEMWIDTDKGIIPVIVTREDGLGVYI